MRLFRLSGANAGNPCRGGRPGDGCDRITKCGADRGRRVQSDLGGSSGRPAAFAGAAVVAFVLPLNEAEQMIHLRK